MEIDSEEAERQLVARIDCNFPYHNRASCLSLVDEAANLPPNAIFFVIEELCRISSSEKENTPMDLLLDLLQLVGAKFDHPLKEMVVDTAAKIIKGKALSVDDVISQMTTVKPYKGQYAVLSILYWSCDEIDDKLESIHDSIIDNWNDRAT